MKSLASKDFYTGALFLLIGISFAAIAWDYPMGTAARMGPGLFPFWLSVLLALLGFMISARSLATPGESVNRFHWRPLLLILGAIGLFALLLRPLGLLAAGVVLVLTAGLGHSPFKLRDMLILAIVLVIFTSIVFVFGLKLPIPLCPKLELFQSWPVCRGTI